MFSKVCLLVGNNWYQSNRYFISKLEEAMQRHGLQTKIIDFHRPDSQDLFAAIASFAPDITCSFNYCVANDQSTHWWNLMRQPHLFMLVDPAAYSPDFFEGRYLMVAAVDQNDCSEIKANGFSNVFFSPHAVEKEFSFDPHMTRDYEVVFLGTCHDYESIKLAWQQKLPKKVAQVLEDAAELFFSKDTLSIPMSLQQIWQEASSSFNETELKTFPLCYRYLERYIRGKDRIELVRSIKKAQVHIFGGLAEFTLEQPVKFDWKHYMQDQSNVTIHPPVPFSEVSKVLNRSKILLNSMPFFRNGSHERVFMALACGCLPVSSESEFLRQEFQYGEVAFYQSSKREHVNDLVDFWLANEPKRRQMAKQGREIVMRHHTWDNRVAAFIKILPSMMARSSI